MDISWFSPPINFTEEKKRLIATSTFEATNSNPNITDKNNNF